MKNTLLVAFLLALVAGFALAAQPRTKAIEHVSPEKFTNLIVEPKGSCTVDFGVVANTALGIPCRESAACEALGAVAGDACLASTTIGVDDGGFPSTVTLSCRAATDAVYFKLCGQFTDAGTHDMPSGTFNGRVIH